MEKQLRKVMSRKANKALEALAPSIPATVDVQSTVEAKRVIRNGLGLFYQHRKTRHGNAVTKG